MFKHLLVPLDGSHLAESVLPVASYLAQTLDAAVTMIHIIERDAPKEVHSDRHLTEPAEAQAYLAEVAVRAFPPTVRIDLHVHTVEERDVSRSIVEHSSELKPDLVVMCTHGRSGPRDWLFGSIAQQVIARGETPVLIIPPKGESSSPFHCRLILVTLDGSADHEGGIPVAVELAQACGASLHFLTVIPTLGTLGSEEAAYGRMLPTAMSAYLDLAEDGARDYLAHHLARLQESGLPMQAEVGRGDPLATITQATHRVSADLIVLGTHQKAGMDAFWAGSVTPRLSGRVDVPLLLVPCRNPPGEIR